MRFSTTHVDRREFFRAAGRYSLLGALAAAAALTGASAIRNRCVSGGFGLCGQCAALTGCGLPPAESFRASRRDTLRKES